MSIFKKKTEVETPIETISKNVHMVEAISRREEKWVYIEGYKGLSADMRATHGNKMQYELNKTYDCPKADVKLCARGFHFSKTMAETRRYYPVREGNRFFKVRALVKEKDLTAYGSYPNIDYSMDFHSINRIMSFSDRPIDKLAACSITLLEELTFEEIKEHIVHPYITTEERYRMSKEELNSSIQSEVISCLLERGYTEDFTDMIYKKMIEEVTRTESVHSGSRYITGNSYVNYALLKDNQKRLEVVNKNMDSKDMMTLYLTKGGF